ncbi:MAG: acyl-ACP--UDP-N-acetylglucosamine O-acyltransferase [Gemmatimonadetes bacterium]|nr:acyl-ACP--UDP-N-acetylglucosamine O-acyltransferase [Gemmatimonadota bacterium]
MTARVHPTAIVDPGAALGPDVVVGPYCIVGPGVQIGAGTTVGPHAVIQRDTTLGAGCAVGPGAVLGADPQDFKYQGEATSLDIGDETRIREYATLHRGTAATGKTVVGKRCYLMAYVHVAHDCVIEDDVVIANAVQLAGHVYVEANATIGGLTPIHQFVRIGRFALVGGGSRVPQDVPPFTRAAGNPMKLYGINSLGLVRAGFPAEVRAALKHAYRLLFNSTLSLSQAVERLRLKSPDLPDVMRLVDFVVSSQRGVPRSGAERGVLV